MAAKSWFRMLGAAFRRDVKIALSYRLAFVLRFLSTLFQVAVFYFISKLVTGSPAGLERYGGNYFAYALVGLAFLRLFSIGLTGYAAAITEAQQMGTLEAQALLPTPLPVLIIGANLWPYLYALGETVLFLLLGWALGAPLHGANMLAAAALALLASLAIGGLGLMGAAMILLFKRGNAVSWAVEAAAGLLAGTYFPIQLLPGPLQKFSRLLPHTWALAGLRDALLKGDSWAQLGPHMLALAGFTLILLPAGILTLRWALVRAQIKGNLAQY